MKYIRLFMIVFLAAFMFSCTKLEEKFTGELESVDNSSITASGLLVNAYNSLYGPFLGNGPIWSATTITSDEAIAPTRGADWFDNGVWQALHAHSWSNDQDHIVGWFTSMLSTQFAASSVLQYNPTPQQAAEARFIRAMSVFWVLDGFAQVPFRENLTDYKLSPTTLKGTEAADFIISELTSIIPDLPDGGPATRATKNAARALLAKVYLNYGVYMDRANPTFPKLTEVLNETNAIIGSGAYEINDNFFDAFAPDNHAKSKESIFTFNADGANGTGGDVSGFVFMVSHYNMSPSGWNGFATLSDFYDKFQATDERRGAYYTYPGAPPNPGHRVNVGFLAGQQYNLTTDAPLEDRNGTPLAFIPGVKLVEDNANTLEFTGIRVIKYPFDYKYGTGNGVKDNDYVMFRYPDILLMKAEALLRNNNAGDALTIVNDLRAKRGATPLASLDLNSMLDERGREMYWESWRRNDLIRFGKFLQPWQEKGTSDPRSLLFPIPSNQLAVNPNLVQNPGYEN